MLAFFIPATAYICSCCCSLNLLLLFCCSYSTLLLLLLLVLVLLSIVLTVRLDALADPVSRHRLDHLAVLEAGRVPREGDHVAKDERPQCRDVLLQVNDEVGMELVESTTVYSSR